MQIKSSLVGLVSLIVIASAAADTKPAPAPSAPKRIEISVTAQGFSPDKVTVAKAQPVILVFTRATEKTCAKDVVIRLGDGTQVKRALPLGKPVEVTATFSKSGELSYACGMDMVTGVITVQ